MGHTMRNLTEMGLLKNRSAFICRPTPEEAMKWGESLDKLLVHKCKILLPLYIMNLLYLLNSSGFGLNPQGWRLHCCIVSGIRASTSCP